jgi:hypothetical protein
LKLLNRKNFLPFLPEIHFKGQKPVSAGPNRLDFDGDSGPPQKNDML